MWLRHLTQIGCPNFHYKWLYRLHKSERITQALLHQLPVKRGCESMDLAADTCHLELRLKPSLLKHAITFTDTFSIFTHFMMYFISTYLFWRLQSCLRLKILKRSNAVTFACGQCNLVSESPTPILFIWRENVSISTICYSKVLELKIRFCICRNPGCHLSLRQISNLVSLQNGL